MTQVGYTRQSASLIITGATILASHFNNEYNQLASAFDNTTGHRHDSTVTGSGATLVVASLGTLTNTTGGILTADGANGFVARTITGTADKITVTNGTGVSGNPTLTIAATYIGQNTITTLGTIATGVWNGTAIGDTYISSATTWNSKQAGDATLTALAAYNTNGILTQTAADTFVGRTLTGTANEITVTNGDGVAGAPTFSLPTALTFTGKTITGGTLVSISSFNKVAITAPTSSATLTIADGKTLTASNTLTFTGTDSSSVAFGTGGTVAYTNVATLSSLASVGTITTGVWNAGVVTSSGAVTGTGFIPTGSSAPTNGVYLPSSNTVGIAGNSQSICQFAGNTAGTPNYVVINNAAAAGTPGISIAGGDTNIGFNFATKGVGGVGFLTNGNVTQFAINHTASAANWLTATGGTAGNKVTLGAAGSDTDIGITLTPKGAGVVTAATAAVGTNTTQVATTAFVLANLNKSYISSTTYTTNTTISSTIPADDTIPQSSEGTQIMSIAYTPNNASSTILIMWEVYGGFSGGTSQYLATALFKDAGADALKVAHTFGTGGAGTEGVSGSYTESAGSTSARTYKLNVGLNSGSFYPNGTAGSTRLYGGKSECRMTVIEILP